MAPVGNQGEVVRVQNSLAQGKKVVHGGSLHGVRGPGRKVALGVRPCDDARHGNFVLRGFELGGFGDGEKFVVVGAKPRADKLIHEIKNASICPLMFAKSFKIHE